MTFKKRVVATGVSFVLAVCVVSCQKKNNAEIRTEPPAATPVEYSYSVASFTNNVTWSPNDSTGTWQPITQALTLAKGVYCETGEKSSVMLTGSLGDVVMMGERAKVRLLVEELALKSGGSSLAMRGIMLFKGRAQFKVMKDQGDFIVETPSAKVKVKGTEFVVMYDEKNGRTDVRVRQGEVEVVETKKPAKNYAVKGGQKLTGIGTSQPVQGEMTAKELEEIKTLPEPGKAMTPEKPREDPVVVRKRLNRESSQVTGAATDAERVRAQAANDSVRTVSRQKMDSVRVDYQVKAQAERDTFANRKAAAEKTVADERNAGQSALEAERAKLRESMGSERIRRSGKADGAFDELERRKQAR